MVSDLQPPQNREPKRISLKEALVIAQGHERRKEFDKARALYAQILRGFPDNRQARTRLAALLPAPASTEPATGNAGQLTAKLMALFNEKEYAQVVALATPEADKYPQSFMLFTLTGAAHYELQEFEKAEQNARKALLLNSNDAAANFNLANALRAQGKSEEAQRLYERAVALDPNLAAARNHLALILFNQGYTDHALQEWRKVIALAPGQKDAHFGLGLCFARKGDHEKAIRFYEAALEIDPDYAEAYDSMGNSMFMLGAQDKALDAFNRALALNPALDNAYSYKFWIQRHLCDFTAQKGMEVRDDLHAFDALAIEDNPSRQQMRAAQEWEKISQRIVAHPLPARIYDPGTKIRIGYFSADFHNHATTQLMAGVYREHDTSRFEIHAFSYGIHKDGEMREEMLRGNLVFHEVEPLADEQIVALARKLEIDIALDLKGYTLESRSQIFAHRLAPVQMNYLAFPGTMGTDIFDYIIADPTLVPPQFREFYSENVLYMPHSYQPNDNTRKADPHRTTRAEHGLPAQGFVFCCFNATYKIGVDEFDIWMRILARIEESVLWLLGSNEWAERNLRTEAQKRGISPERIIFAEKTVHPRHLERHRHADLFLDTFNYNAHTTTSDALWAGLPVVTKIGKQFAARVAASLLNAMECPDLVTGTVEEYEAKILDLATNPQKLHSIRNGIVQRRRTAPLFDTRRYTRNLETGFELALERHKAGLAPADIMVQETIAAL